MGEVVHRAHPADAEEGQRGARAPIGRGPDQAEPPGDRAHDKDRGHGDEDAGGAQRPERAIHRGAAEQQQEDDARQPLQGLGEVVEDLVVLVVELVAAQGDGGDEHRQEPVSLGDLGDAVHHERRADGYEALPGAGEGQR